MKVRFAFRHMALVRSYVGVTPFAEAARKVMLRTCLASSRVREDLADIVNMAIEELVRQRYELPGFSTLFRAARAARVTVNRGYYRQIYQATDPVTRTHIDTLFEKGLTERRSSWDRVKSEPGQPTVKRIRAFLVHLDWLRKQAASNNPLIGIPAVKLQRFAAEARVLNVARMKELRKEKRFALAAALLFRQLAQAYDDAADMLIRQVRYPPTTQQQLTQKQALLRIPGTRPSSPDNFLVALSLRCRVTAHYSGGH